VFAVRAFKHAIFGTPQTTQPKARRNSSTDNGRPRHGDNKSARPGLNRPKSASDAQTLGRQQYVDIPEPLMSPTKGILLTPGTAAAKKKNVTFGDHVVDNEQKRPLNNGPDEEGAGDALADDSEPEDDALERQPSRGRLAEALEQARDESKKRRSKGERRSKKFADDDLDVPPEYVEPKADSGKYWKREYDIYRTNTQREVKKLITKQKAAKSFAHAKDIQCTELADELRQERKKVENLEAKVDGLAASMKDLHEQLLSSRMEAEGRTEGITTLKQGRKDSTRPESRDMASLVPQQRPTSSQGAERNVSAEVDPVQRPSEPYKPPRGSEKPKMDLQTLRARVKSKPEPVQPKPADDIWAQSFGSSSPVATRKAEVSRASKGGYEADQEPQSNALQALDVNTLANGRDTGRTTTGKAPGAKDLPHPGIETLTDHKEASDDMETAQPPTLPQHADLPNPSTTAAANTQHERHQTGMEDGNTEADLSMPVPESSPFQPQAHTLQSTSRRTAGLTGPRVAPTSRPSQPYANAKENVSPTSGPPAKPQPPQHEPDMKPSAMWTSFNAPQANKRSTSITGKSGKEASSDRVEAARARINARGRVAT